MSYTINNNLGLAGGTPKSCMTTPVSLLSKGINMKQIPLTQGKFAIVDDEYYEYLMQWKWYARKDENTYYAVRWIMQNGKGIIQRMHRLILGLKKGDGKYTDHQNHNGLDNRLRNIRACTCSQNQQNRLPLKNISSRYKGVHLYKRTGKWKARIRLGKQSIHLGCFDKEIEAALAYDMKAKELFGEFAYLNFH